MGRAWAVIAAALLTAAPAVAQDLGDLSADQDQFIEPAPAPDPDFPGQGTLQLQPPCDSERAATLIGQPAQAAEGLGYADARVLAPGEAPGPQDTRRLTLVVTPAGEIADAFCG